jgi:Type II secretory pathway, pullulanase PulA and related glycosidases
MDVVYNHVSSAAGSNFNILVPGYYFRLSSTGAFSNGSGCGNETASDHYMMRKFMIDSASYWTKEYKLGGFRFDLMGLHDIETMNELTAACQKINPKIAIYGEPWTGGSTTLSSDLQAKQANLSSFVGYGAFNDKIRDALIKGGLNSTTSVGWATSFDTNYKPAGDVATVVGGIKGITGSSTSGVADPDKSIAYVACHDNYTLHDRIRFLTSREENIMKAAKLAEAVVFTSQGTSFMLSGDEFLRHKPGTNAVSNGNSYNASYDVNALDYNLKITNASMFTTMQKLVSLKQKVDGLHLDAEGIKSLSVTVSSDSNMLTYEINDTANSKTYKIVHACGVGTLPSVDFSGYSLYLDTLESGVTLSAATTISPFQSIIAVK